MKKLELTQEQIAQRFEIKDNEYGVTCLYDKNNNSWSLEIHSIEEAIEASKTLRNCKNCRNCMKCKDCMDCDTCYLCENCKD
ncbi:hypothetical protein [Helicobacter rodentium]|nr:hypothetical protein [Helicobacter rodentium]